MKIPVILLNYNSTSDCRKCVGFLKQQEGVETEIIIVDNASADAAEAEKLCKEEGLTFLQSATNRGYNAGNNIGLRYAAEQGYEYALIANPDMEFPDVNYIHRLASELDNHPETSVVGSDILTPENIHQNPMLPDGGWTASFGLIKDILFPRKKNEAYDFIGDFRITAQCFKLSGCSIMVRLNHIASLGFFDEYPFLYCEEAILAKQVLAAGHTMRYVADTAAIHRHISSAKGDPRPRFRQWRRSRLYFIDKYSGYSRFGKMMAAMSWKMYFSIMNLAFNLKKR